MHFETEFSIMKQKNKKKKKKEKIKKSNTTLHFFFIDVVILGMLWRIYLLRSQVYSSSDESNNAV